MLGTQIGQLADPLAPVDAQDTTKQVVTVAPGATATDIGADLQQRGLIRSSSRVSARRRAGRASAAASPPGSTS